MKSIPLTEQECRDIHPGAVTMATVTLVFTIVILSVVAYKIFTSKGSKITMPGGFKFEFSGNGGK